MVDNASFEYSEESSGESGYNNARTDVINGHAIKPLSGSAPSVRVSTISTSGTGDTADTKDGKQPSKSRQKKFQRHFPQVGPEERVLNYYSCALVGDLLLQGHLYITKNYFAFYSNVFGYVTKLLIPTTSVLRITKEKVARIIPNAVGVCTRDERHVFGSLLSRDSTYKLMMHVWKAARGPEQAIPKPQDPPVSEVEIDVSEYSPEDDSSSAGGEPHGVTTTPVRRESEAIIAAAGAAVIQPALLTGGAGPTPVSTRGSFLWWCILVVAAALLTLSASLLAYKLYHATYHSQQEEVAKLTGEELYSELVRWRARLHGRAATELHAFLTTNLLLLTKVSEEDLPDCRPRQVCSKVDLYDATQPWIERKCRCIGHRPCSSDITADDNRTLADKTTLYKTCDPVKRLPKCRYFKDAAWIIYSFPDSNATQQIVNCHCPKFSVTYLLKKLPYTTPSGQQGNQYQFACSPQSRLRCSRKEPCKLFSARRRHEQIDEVNANTICQCPRGHTCPRHHTETGVLAGITYAAEDIRTYHGYCMPEPPPDAYRFVGDKD